MLTLLLCMSQQGYLNLSKWVTTQQRNFSDVPTSTPWRFLRQTEDLMMIVLDQAHGQPV